MCIGGGGLARRPKAAESKGRQNGYFKFKKLRQTFFKLLTNTEGNSITEQF